MMYMMVNSMIMTLILLSFILYFFSSHPMLIASLVISQCILMSSLISMKMYFSWFSFFIFIIYLGGILMLFSYVISLINSSKPILKSNKFLKILLTLYISLNFFKETTSKMDVTTTKFMKMIMSSFSTSLMKLSIYLMMFLFFIMIVVVFLTEMNKGNMRKL